MNLTLTKEQKQIRSHNAMLSEFPMEHRKSRAALLLELEALCWADGYPDASELAEAGLKRAEELQLSGGFRPKDLHRAKHEYGYLKNSPRGWKPELWVLHVETCFPKRERVFCERTLFEVVSRSKFGLPYELLVFGQGDLHWVKSAGEEHVKAHNKLVDAFENPIMRAGLVKAVCQSADLTKSDANVIVHALELGQAMGGLKKSTLSEAFPQNQKKVDLVWSALASRCPTSRGFFFYKNGRSEQRLHCPYRLVLEDDGMTVSEAKR